MHRTGVELSLRARRQRRIMRVSIRRGALSKVGQISVRFRTKFLQATWTTEKVFLPIVGMGVDGGDWIHLHSADGIFDYLPVFGVGIMIFAGGVILCVFFVVNH